MELEPDDMTSQFPNEQVKLSSNGMCMCLHVCGMIRSYHSHDMVNSSNTTDLETFML